MNWIQFRKNNPQFSKKDCDLLEESGFTPPSNPGNYIVYSDYSVYLMPNQFTCPLTPRRIIRLLLDEHGQERYREGLSEGQSW